ncbi:hypothetical protein DBV39_00920 [Orrella marina]|uniref:Uncharacterized protein n=1 Tax=Orrella marina TaxID=2163011 RepID=A0A2R4XFD9_9BURK|nr:hypothetical protein DBV39_00920 [Orrella marina]
MCIFLFIIYGLLPNMLHKQACLGPAFDPVMVVPELAILTAQMIALKVLPRVGDCRLLSFSVAYVFDFNVTGVL